MSVPPASRPTTESTALDVRSVPVQPLPDRPTVSVVIPCFNYARYLRAAVTSVLTQRGVEVSVIVVDDASTDDSVAIARELARQDSRVQVIACPVNRGAVETFNAGLDLVTGEFLVRLDADDLLTPGSLARSTALARAYPSVGLVYGRPTHFTGAPPTSARQQVLGWRIWPGGRWLAGRCADAANVITSPEVLMRSSVVGRVGGQQPLRHTHDMEMWFRIAAVSDVGYVRGSEQAWHRDHPASLSATHTDPVEELLERERAFTVLFSGVAGQRGDAAVLLRSARRALARDALRRATHAVDRGRGKHTPLDDLETFALRMDPQIIRTRAWRSWQRRRESETTGRQPALRVFALVSPAVRMVNWRIRRARWLRTGTYSRR